MSTPTLLVDQLRSMARLEHDDLSIGDDAADEIERLQSELAALRAAQPEPVAEVGAAWSLVWAGREPLATLLARHPSVRIGTKLFASPPPAQPSAEDLTDTMLAIFDAVGYPYRDQPGKEKMSVSFKRWFDAQVAAQPAHVPVSPELAKEIDDALGLFDLPAVRVDRSTYASLKEAAKARGVILQAIIRERLAPYTLPAQPAQANPWRDAIDEALVVAHLGVATEPYDDLNKLLQWHHEVWLDPAVSSDAQALIDRGAAEERARAAQPKREPLSDAVDALLASVPIPPNAITYEKGWKLLDELQRIAIERLTLGEQK